MSAAEASPAAPGSWDHVPLLDHPPGRPEDGENWYQVDEYGLAVLVLWSLRHDRAASSLHTEAPVTKLTQETSGQTSTWERPRTAQEQSDVDDDLDSLLADAGVPPRPRGRRWFVRLPADVDLESSLREWWREIYQQLDDEEQTPAGELHVLGEILKREGLTG
jgi:hypothetical protein